MYFQSARMQICRCVIHICQAVDGPSLPPDIKVRFELTSHVIFLKLRQPRRIKVIL
jgi:hypothetical protein